MSAERRAEGRIGPYRILEQLGVGGMGEVLLAYDERLDRRVAIKRIRLESAGRPERRERFRREARLAARLNHPAIVQVHDILQEDGTDSIVMEYVPGTSLREMVRQGPLPAPRTLELAREIADAMDAAHRAGIVHRDLKTENVLVTAEGRAKIADFGIAKHLLAEEDEESLTGELAVLGTCRSMAPEQARGEPVDHRSDLFAFGVLLYEALTGRSPFLAANRMATLERVIWHRPAPVSELVPAVPREVSELVDRLLEKDPNLRPPSAGAVRRELDRLVSASGDAAAGETVLTDGPPSTWIAAPPPAGPPPAADAAPAAPGGPRWRAALHRPAGRAMAAALLLAGLGGAYLALRPLPPPVYVAVLAPELGTGAGGELELLAAGVRVALLQGLVALEGISPQAFEEVDAAAGSPQQVARAVAADELVGARLDCRAEVCRVALTRRRGSDGSVLWVDSLDLPTDDWAVAAGVLRSRIRHGYPDHRVRDEVAGVTEDRSDLDALLRLRRRFKANTGPPGPILAELAGLRRRTPRSLELDLLEIDVLQRQFWASRDARDFERALARIRGARARAPGDPRVLFELVDLALLDKRLELADGALAELASLVPGDARLLEQQALLLDARGQSEAALARMRTAARLQPSSKRLHNLAQLELQHGDMAAARTTLERLLARAPRNVEGLSLLAQIELAGGDLRRAVALYRELVRISPGIAELSNLGLAHIFLGEYAAAEPLFRRAYDLQPGHPVLALNLADACLLRGRKPEAEALYGQVVDGTESEAAARDPQMLTVRAQALAHLGEGRRAATAVRKALVLAPDQGPVAFEAALVYALLDEEDSALSSAETAIRHGIGERWFSLPWFSRLRQGSDLDQLLGRTAPEQR